MAYQPPEVAVARKNEVIAACWRVERAAINHVTPQAVFPVRGIEIPWGRYVEIPPLSTGSESRYPPGGYPDPGVMFNTSWALDSTFGELERRPPDT